MNEGGRVLVLVKHSVPEIVKELPAAQWELSAEGKARCSTLAELLRGYAPDIVVSSVEPKASETGRLVAAALEVPFRTNIGLHEHDRSGVPYYEAADEFEAEVRRLMERPDTLVMGAETADEARERLTSALNGIVAELKDESIAVVSHGTVIALFVAQAVGIEPFPLWKRLGSPSFVVLSLPKFELQEVVETV